MQTRPERRRIRRALDQIEASDNVRAWARKGDTAAACDPLFAAFPIWSFQSLAASHFLDVVIELSTTSMKVAGSKGLVR